MASRLRQALDMSSARPSDAQLLRWDSSTGRWVPYSVTASDVGAAEASHTHAGSDITSAVAQADNATTLNSHPDTDFALADHPHVDATTSTSGFMTAADKAKLDGLGSATPKSAVALGLSLTSVYQSVPGMSVTVDKAGTWLVLVTVAGNYDSADDPYLLSARLMVGGVAQDGTITARGSTTTVRFTSTQHWLYTAPNDTPATVTVEAQKTGGSGSSEIFALSTHMTAIWLSA